MTPWGGGVHVFISQWRANVPINIECFYKKIHKQKKILILGFELHFCVGITLISCIYNYVIVIVCIN